MVAVYWVLPRRAADGINVAVLPLMLTRPLVAAPSEVVTRVKLVVVSVEFVIASEKVADTEEFSATPLAAFAGDVADTIGAVVSGTVPVVKFQMKLAASALPAESFAPVVMVAVYCAIAAREAKGVKVAELLVTLTVPAIGEPPCVVSLNVSVFSVDFNMTSEKVTAIAEFTATLIVAFAGEVEDTAGGVVSEAGVVVTTAGSWEESASDSTAPPHPDRPSTASSTAGNNPKRILDTTSWRFDMR
jgi:hypothetical protein